AAAANRSRAASPGVRRPLCSSGPFSARADEPFASRPAPTVAAPAAVSPFFTNERRLIAVFMLLHMFSIGHSPQASLDVMASRKLSAEGKKIVFFYLEIPGLYMVTVDLEKAFHSRAHGA